jgi:hypothetical protein
MGNTCQVLHTEVEQHLSCNVDESDCMMSHGEARYCCTDNELDLSDFTRLEAESFPDGVANQVINASLHRSRSSPSYGSVLAPINLATPLSQRRHSIQYPKKLVRARNVERCGASTIQRQSIGKENVRLQGLRPLSARHLPRLEQKVDVHLYDLSEGFAQINAVSIDLIGFGGGLHTGVEVYGHEWSFGTGGVSCSVPKKNRNYVYRQTVHMGNTMLTSQEVEDAIMALQQEWSGSDYDLFSKNCGTFSNALCVRLGVGSLPPWITRLAEAGAKSSTVRRIADLMVRHGIMGEASPSSSCPCGGSGSEYGSPVRNLAALNAEFSPLEDEWLEQKEGTPEAFDPIESPAFENHDSQVDVDQWIPGARDDAIAGLSASRRESRPLHEAALQAPLRALAFDDGSNVQDKLMERSRSAPGSLKLAMVVAGGGG